MKPSRRLTFHIEVPPNIRMKDAKVYVIEALARWAYWRPYTKLNTDLIKGLTAEICTQDSLKLEQQD